MRRLLLTAFCLFSLGATMGQTTFQRHYGKASLNEWGYSAQQTNDGGYILQGNNEGGLGGIILYKVNPVGDTMWTSSFPGIGCYSVQQTSDNGYILFGFKLIKTNASGQQQWSKDVSDIFGPLGAGYCIQQTSDGGYIASGIKTDISDNLAIAKLNSLGDTVWTKSFGGSGQDRGNFVRQTNDGGYIVTGFYFNNTSSSWDIYLVKPDSNGNETWNKKFGGNQHDMGYCVQQTTDGGYIILGETNSFGNGNKDLYLIKTNAVGDSMWTKTFGGTRDDYGRYVQQTADGGYIITGGIESFGNGSNFYPDVYLIKTEASGSLSWYKTFGIPNYPDGGSYVQQTTDGGYMVFGGGNYPSDMFLIKTNSSGITSLAQNDNELETSVFPNPFSQQTTLYCHKVLNNAALTVWNALGQSVKSLENISGESILFNRGGLPSGLYFLHVIQGSELVTIKKIVVTD